MRTRWPRSSRSVRNWLRVTCAASTSRGCCPCRPRSWSPTRWSHPVPPNLHALTPALTSLADFLRLDEDLLVIAARGSERMELEEPAEVDLARWVQSLPTQDKDALLLRVARGEDASLRLELLRRWRGEPARSAGAAAGRTVADLLKAAAARRVERVRTAERQQAQARAQAERAAALVREQRLASLAAQEDSAWRRVSALVESKKPREYDVAVQLLADLRALGERQGTGEVFQRRLSQLQQQHQRKTTFLERLHRAGL